MEPSLPVRAVPFCCSFFLYRHYACPLAADNGYSASCFARSNAVSIWEQKFSSPICL